MGSHIVDRVKHHRKGKWMQKAFSKHPGALTKKAHAAGESPMAFARSHAHTPGKTGQQARLALIAQGEAIPGGKKK